MSRQRSHVLRKLYLTLLAPLVAVGLLVPLFVGVVQAHDEVLRRRARACLDELEARTGPEVDALEAQKPDDVVGAVLMTCALYTHLRPSDVPEQRAQPSVWALLEEEQARPLALARTLGAGLRDASPSRPATNALRRGVQFVWGASTKVSVDGAWGSSAFWHDGLQDVLESLLVAAPAALVLLVRAWLRWLLRPAADGAGSAVGPTAG